VKTRYPELKVSVLEGSGGQIEEWLSSGHISIGALFRHGVRPSDRNEELLSTVDAFLVGMADDPVTSSPTVDFARLAGLPLILSRSPNGLRTQLEQIALQKGVELCVAMEVNSLSLHRKLVADGCGYTVLSSYAISHDSLAHRLSAARIVRPHIKRYLTLATTPKRPLSFAEREVAAMMRTIALELSLS
jgi:DNA-binding transcriptional LysR family regulator